ANLTAKADADGGHSRDDGHASNERILAGYVHERQPENGAGKARAEHVAEAAAYAPCKANGDRHKRGAQHAVRPFHGRAARTGGVSRSRPRIKAEIDRAYSHIRCSHE